MSIEQLEISNFRNLKQVSLIPSSNLNAIVGDNGSGKTSVLEAIYFVGTAKSFRTPHSKQAIRFGEPQFVLFGKLSSGSGSNVPIGISRDQQSITIKVANQVASNASTLAGILPVQLVNPDVHKLLEEGPRYRRRFLEWGLFHVKPNYFEHWQECRHILKQRNAALKQNLAQREIEHWDGMLCEKSDLITQMRRQYLEDLQPIIMDLLTRVASLPEVEVRLSQGWSKSKSLAEVLRENLPQDRQRGFTQFGPQRVDLFITCQGVRAKEVVSRGQQKIITALLKLAQLQLLNGVSGYPKGVLLVDDLPAELDHNFRQFLMEIIAGLENQVFVTATDSELLELDHSRGGLKMFHVEQGRVEGV